MDRRKGNTLLFFSLLAFTAGAFLFFGKYFGVFFHSVPPEPATVVESGEVQPSAVSTQPHSVSDAPSLSHIPTPDAVRAIYLTGWSAGTKRMVDHAFSIFDSTDINSVVIDVKDATGKLSYEPLDANLAATGVGTKRIADLPALIDRLHARGIYVIGRVQAFEDPFYVKAHPEAAFENTKTKGEWTNYGGLAWLRPDDLDTQRYIASIAADAYAQGFDEINLDYVRFPTDGPLSQMADRPATSQEREAVLTSFFSFMNDELRTKDHIPLSADLFGLTLSTTDDMGIGQKLEAVAPLVDYVDGMIYPSHFAAGTYGYANPSEHPYEMINDALSAGKKKLLASGMSEEEVNRKLRPWLQDFDLLGVHYDTAKVLSQIQATNNQGIQSFLMWDPRNIYTSDAFVLPDAQNEVLTTPVAP